MKHDNDVLPYLLTVQDTLILPTECLEMFATTCTNILLKRINEYIDKNRNSLNSDNKKASEVLDAIFKPVNERISYLQSDRIGEMISELYGITYSDINAGVEPERLKGWKIIIEELQTERNAVAKLSVISDDVRLNVVDYYDNIIKGEIRNNYSLEQKKAIMRLRDKLVEYPKYFKDPIYAKVKSTRLAGLLGRRAQLELFLHGINFLLAKHEAGLHPASWRKF